eukprot:2945842-Rhodomonas_salina.1
MSIEVRAAGFSVQGLGFSIVVLRLWILAFDFGLEGSELGALGVLCVVLKRGMMRDLLHAVLVHLPPGLCGRVCAVLGQDCGARCWGCVTVVFALRKHRPPQCPCRASRKCGCVHPQCDGSGGQRGLASVGGREVGAGQLGPHPEPKLDPTKVTVDRNRALSTYGRRLESACACLLCV